MDRKQIVMIMTDTQRWDMINGYRETGLKTPYLDKLIGEGIRFDRAYTCQPVCGPARSALFTGTFPHSNGSWGNTMPLGENVKTIGQRLSDRDIKTAYIGKWHLDAGDYFGNGICPEGWDEAYWYDMRNYLLELTDDERKSSRKQELMDIVDVPEEFTYGHGVAKRAIKFIKEHKDEDFFLVVSFDEPHGPFISPKKYVDMYEDYTFPKPLNVYDDLMDKPDKFRFWAGDDLNENKKAITISQKYFFACNTFVDKLIGDVMCNVDEHIDDALVIYTSDHGDALKSHSIHGKGPSVFDEITRIPFIVRKKGMIEVRTDNSPVSHIDIMPTVMDYFDLPLPKLLEGKSMINHLKGGEATNSEVFIEFARYEIDHDGFGGFQPMRAITDGRYKLSINLLDTDEMYDTLMDTGEMINLINDPNCSKIRDDLHDRLLNWMDRTRDPFRGYQWERREWRIDAKRATWDCNEMTRQREDSEYSPQQFDYDTGMPMAGAVRRKGSGDENALVIPKSLDKFKI